MNLSNNSRNLRILYAISVVYSLFILLLPPVISNDTESYFLAWDVLCSGSIDATRTPLYPIFLGIIQSLGGGLHVVAVLQCLIFNASIFFFYRIVSMVTHKSRLAFYATLIYLLSPQTAQWSSVVLTESLSVSLMVFWLYVIVRIICDGYSHWRALSYGVILLLMLMLRPALAYCLVAAAVLCLWLVRRRKAFIGVVLATALPAMLLGGYCLAFYNAYGVFAPSRVGDINNAIILKLNHDNIDTQVLTDVDLRSDWDFYLHTDPDPYGGYTRLQDIYGIKRMHQAVEALREHNRVAGLKHVFVRYTWFVSNARTLKYQPPTAINNFLQLICLSGRGFILLPLIYLAFTIWLYRRGGWHIVSVILCVLMAAGVALNIIGAQDDYIRLSTALVPIIIVAMAHIFSFIRFSYLYGVDSQS